MPATRLTCVRDMSSSLGIFDRFERFSTCSIVKNEGVVDALENELMDTKKTILRYLGI